MLDFTHSWGVIAHDERHSLLSLPILLEEPSGVERLDEPVTVGMPLPSGRFFEPTTLRLRDQGGRSRPVQVEVLARWSDGSLRWALLDFQASLKAYEQAVLYLERINEDLPESPSQKLELQQTADSMIVDTGVATFFINRSVLKPFDRVVVQGDDILEASGSRFALTDEAGREYEPHVQDISVETRGHLRTTVRLDGALRDASEAVFARFNSSA